MQECGRFDEITAAISKKYFSDFCDVDEEMLSEKAAPIVVTSFCVMPGGEPAYMPVPNMDRMTEVLEHKLGEYNEANAIMNLVLFEMAMRHVCRIARVVELNGGNAMLIGVGGSGKQSLSRLAAFIVGCDCRQLNISSKFTLTDLHENLQSILRETGVKENPTVLLMTDSQIVDDRFLVPLSNLLNLHWVPGLFANDELEEMFGALRNQAKNAGISESREAMLDFPYIQDQKEPASDPLLLPGG